MVILGFTVEETNLVAIYRKETNAATLSGIISALPHMDGEMLRIAASAGRKLNALTEDEFSETSFIAADDREGGGQVDMF